MDSRNFPLEMSYATLSFFNIREMGRNAAVCQSWNTFHEEKIARMTSRTAVITIMSLPPRKAYDFIRHVLVKNQLIKKSREAIKQKEDLLKDKITIEDAWNFLLVFLTDLDDFHFTPDPSMITQALIMVCSLPDVDVEMQKKLNSSIYVMMIVRFPFFRELQPTMHFANHYRFSVFTNLTKEKYLSNRTIEMPLPDLVMFSAFVQNTHFFKVSLRRGILPSTIFQSCTFEIVDIRGTNLACSSFINCKINLLIIDETTILINTIIPEHLKIFAKSQGAILTLSDLIDRCQRNFYPYPQTVLKDVFTADLFAAFKTAYESTESRAAPNLADEITLLHREALQSPDDLSTIIANWMKKGINAETTAVFPCLLKLLQDYQQASQEILKKPLIDQSSHLLTFHPHSR